MNCQEVSELLPAVLDGELRDHERPALEHHLNECRQCRNELELQSMAKRIIQQRLKRVAAPPAVAAAVLGSLHEEDAPGKAFSWEQILPFRLSWKPAIAFAAFICVIAAVLLIPSSKPKAQHLAYVGPNDADIIHQTYNNFDQALAGTLIPQVASRNPDDLKRFFAQKASFSVSVPKIKRANLMGGSISQSYHSPVAHILYKRGDDLIYLYQVKLQDVIDESNLVLPSDAKQELLENCTYVRNHQPNCTILIKIVDSNVCCFVADIPREELISYLEENK